MPTCKKCGEVVGALEIKDGLCINCMPQESAKEIKESIEKEESTQKAQQKVQKTSRVQKDNSGNFLGGIIGGIIGVGLVYKFWFDPIEYMGWELFWSSVKSYGLHAADIKMALHSSTFHKSLLGFVVGYFLGSST